MAQLLDIKKRIRQKKRERNFTKEFQVRDLREKEFFTVDNLFIDKYMRLVGVGASCVYFSLCRHVGKDQICFPSIRLMCDELKMGPSTILRSVKILEWHNIVKVDKIKGEPNIYTLLNKKQWRQKKTVGWGVECKGEVNGKPHQYQGVRGPAQQLKRNRQGESKADGHAMHIS